MPGRKKDGTLSLNAKKIANSALSLENKLDSRVRELLFIMWLILVRVWRDNLHKYYKVLLRRLLIIVLNTIILPKNYWMHFSTNPGGKLFLNKILFWWNLIKSEHKLKYQNNNDLIKLILYVSGIKLLKLTSKC